MSDCLFCKIVGGQIPASVVHETANVLAFEDVNPQAPIHLLIIPKKHIATANDLQAEDAAIIGEMYMVAKQIATEKGFADDGYRLVMNCNEKAGQTVFHIHLHMLAGRTMTWPPG